MGVALQDPAGDLPLCQFVGDRVDSQMVDDPCVSRLKQTGISYPFPHKPTPHILDTLLSAEEVLALSRHRKCAQQLAGMKTPHRNLLNL